MLGVWEGSEAYWVGRRFADNIDNENFIRDGEVGSPEITQEMIDMAASDPFHRYVLPNGMIFLLLTYEIKDRNNLVYIHSLCTLVCNELQ